MIQVVECLPNNHRALSSNYSTAKKKKKNFKGSWTSRLFFYILEQKNLSQTKHTLKPSFPCLGSKQHSIPGVTFSFVLPGVVLTQETSLSTSQVPGTVLDPGGMEE
jgi:hypothetical protein